MNYFLPSGPPTARAGHVCGRGGVYDHRWGRYPGRATDTGSSELCRHLLGPRVAVSPAPVSRVATSSGREWPCRRPVPISVRSARAQVCRLIGHAGIVTASGGGAAPFRPARRFCPPRRAADRLRPAPDGASLPPAAHSRGSLATYLQMPELSIQALRRRLSRCLL